MYYTFTGQVTDPATNEARFVKFAFDADAAREGKLDMGVVLEAIKAAAIDIAATTQVKTPESILIPATPAPMVG